MDKLRSCRKLCFFLLLCVFLSRCNSTTKNEEESATFCSSSSKKWNSSYDAFQYKSWFEGRSTDYSFRNDFIAAFYASKSGSSGYGKDLNKPDWKAIGPFDIAGRSLCLAIHPSDTQKLWMGSAGSGLWHSRTGGIGPDAWKNVPLGLPVQSVSSISLDPNNPSTIYIGTGENYSLEDPGGGIHNRTFRGSRGVGLLKSEDGGLSWKLILDYLDRPDLCIWKIIVPKDQSQVIYLSGNMGILKSENKGGTWTPIFDTCLVMDMLIQENNSNILYAGVGGIQGNKYGLYKSVDAGRNWKLIESPAGDKLDGRIMLSACKSQPQKIMAAFASAFSSKGILRSIDGFEQTKFYTPIKDVCAHQGWYAKCLHIKDDDPQKLLMGGVDLYYDSSGTGNKLTNLIFQKIKIHADFHDIISNPLDPNKIYLSTDGGMYRSNDFCKTVFPCNQGYLSSQFYTGSIHASKSVMLGGLQDNKSVLFENNIWNNIHFGDGTYSAFHPLKEQFYFISSQFQNLYQSENEGADWKELIAPNKNAAFVAPFILHSHDPDFMYSGGNQLLTTENGGQTWKSTALSTNSEKIVAIHASHHKPEMVLLASYDPVSKCSFVYASDDRGKTLRKSTIEFKNSFIRDITGHHHLPYQYYAALSSFGEGGLISSSDGGITWKPTANQGLPKIPCHSILLDPVHSETIYLGTDLGLYVSFDQGQNWESYNAHPFDIVPVYDIQYDPPNDKIVLFTHGFGAFVCQRLEKSIPTQTGEAETKVLKVFMNHRFITSVDIPGFSSLKLYHLNGSEVTFSFHLNQLYIKESVPGVYILQSSKPKPWSRKLILQ